MKLVVSEKVKHRLIGIAVIISLGAIFAPAMMKKSNQNFESTETVHVKLPPKPSEPKVAVSDEQELFQTIKIASRVEPIPTEMEPIATKSAGIEKQQQENTLPTTHEKDVVKQPEFAVKNIDPVISKSIALAAKDSAKEMTKQTPSIASIKKAPAVIASAKKRGAQGTKKVTAAVKSKSMARHVQLASQKNSRSLIRKASRPVVRANVYAVQLAAFSKLSNAQSLVQKLKNKGYKASYTRVVNREGVAYKVYAGHSKRRADVMRVKNQLASLQLKGFIVTTGVS